MSRWATATVEPQCRCPDRAAVSPSATSDLACFEPKPRDPPTGDPSGLGRGGRDAAGLRACLWGRVGRSSARGVAVGAGVHAFLAAFRVPRQRPVGPPDSFGLVYDGDHDARRVPAEPTETQGARDQGTFDDPVRRGDDAQSGAPVNLAPEQVCGGALELGPAMSNNSMLVDVVVAAGQGVSELRRPGLSPAGADHAASSLGRARSPPARCPCTSALHGVYPAADRSTYVRQRLEATCQRQGGVFGQGRSTSRLWPVLIRR